MNGAVSRADVDLVFSRLVSKSGGKGAKKQMGLSFPQFEGALEILSLRRFAGLDPEQAYAQITDLVVRASTSNRASPSPRAAVKEQSPPTQQQLVTRLEAEFGAENAAPGSPERYGFDNTPSKYDTPREIPDLDDDEEHEQEQVSAESLSYQFGGGRIGLRFSEAAEGLPVRIAEVIPGSQADGKGLAVGVPLTAVNGVEVGERGHDEVIGMIRAASPGGVSDSGSGGGPSLTFLTPSKGSPQYQPAAVVTLTLHHRQLPSHAWPFAAMIGSILTDCLRSQEDGQGEAPPYYDDDGSGENLGDEDGEEEEEDWGEQTTYEDAAEPPQRNVAQISREILDSIFRAIGDAMRHHRTIFNHDLETTHSAFSAFDRDGSGGKFSGAICLCL